MRNIAIIPARAGSKRLPGKNTILFRGRPLIFWTIQAALESEEIDRVLFTTESEDISNIAIACATEIESDCLLSGRFNIIRRSAELAADEVQVDAVMKHAATKLEADDIVIVLQPTSPLRLARDIDEAVLLRRDGETVISVTPAPGFYWMYDAPSFKPIGHDPLRRAGEQWTEWNVMRENGAIYVTSVDRIRSTGCVRSPQHILYSMPEWRSIDINTAEDYEKAEEYANQFLG